MPSSRMSKYLSLSQTIALDFWINFQVYICEVRTDVPKIALPDSRSVHYNAELDRDLSLYLAGWNEQVVSSGG